MGTLLLVFGFMLFIVLIMSVGVLAGRKPISGSCGGMSAIGLDSKCDICGGNRDKCDEVQAAKKESGQVEDLAYDATSPKSSSR